MKRNDVKVAASWTNTRRLGIEVGMTQNGLEREVIGGMERAGGKDGEEVLVVGFGWLAQSAVVEDSLGKLACVAGGGGEMNMYEGRCRLLTG